ncbi:TetR family transcriptional regulator, partial [Stenotrophomonas maltophilia]|nr:TetR family transcriptional regulator [Stenotrophomonas maltophilia]
MARRTKEDAHATRERILDAALVCLLRHGPAGATL